MRHGQNCPDNIWPLWRSDMFGKVRMQYSFRLLHCIWIWGLHCLTLALECATTKHCGRRWRLKRARKSTNSKSSLDRTRSSSLLCSNICRARTRYFWIYCKGRWPNSSSHYVWRSTKIIRLPSWSDRRSNQRGTFTGRICGCKLPWRSCSLIYIEWKPAKTWDSQWQYSRKNVNVS